MAEEELPDRGQFPSVVWKRWDERLPEGKLEADRIPDRRRFEMCPLPAPFLTTDTAREPGTPPEIQFLPPGLRLALRNVPLIVFATLIAVVVEAEVNPNADGLSVLIPDLPVAPLLSLGVLPAGLLLLFAYSEITDLETVFKASFVYGLLGVLLVGTLFGGYRTVSTSGDPAVSPYVVYVFPTLFFTLLIGLFAYDLLLRGEYMFSNLGELNVIDGDRYAESEEYGELGETLSAGIGLLRYGHFFMILILVQFTVIWSFGGPLGTGLYVSIAFNIGINVLVLTGVFNSLVGFVFFRKLVTGQVRGKDGASVGPGYLPYHSDGRGGYRDIGRMAMRINVILILAGMYYAYRGYMSGLRTYPPTTELSFAPLYAELLGIAGEETVEILFWVINYLGPVLLYVLVVAFWFYYTFWEIHKRMVKLKQDTILRLQHANRLERMSDATGEQKEDLALVETPLGELPDRTELYDAPEWPVNSQRIGWLLTGNVLPILLSVLTVVPELAG